MNESRSRLLVVEDDAPLSQRLADGLVEAGYAVERASSRQEARGRLEKGLPKLVLLDLGLPDGDGLNLLREMREKHADLPVIITTARVGIVDRVNGLEVGADDYLIKPYAFEELLARIRTQLRHFDRIQLGRSVGNLELNLENRSALLGGNLLVLTPREFDLLAFLASLNGKVASRDRIQRAVWNVKSRMTSMDNVIDVHIFRLRQKLGQDKHAPQLHTIRGVGIALKEPE